MATEQTLSTLVINKVESIDVFNRMVTANKVNANELYLTPETSGEKILATCTLRASSWYAQDMTASIVGGPVLQDVTISGILSTDTPYITPNFSTTRNTALLEQNAWNCVSEANTATNKITFKCFSKAPTQDLSLTIEIVR